MLGKVLVADDNLNIQRSVTAALKAEDIEVVAVSHGEAAVRKIPEVKPDLILADVFMPVRTGYEVCEFVKKDPTLSHIPVLLLVGALEPLDQKEVGRVRADGFLKKPFESGQLVSTVKGYLSKIVRKPTPEMQQAAQEFAAAIPIEAEIPAEEEAPHVEDFATRPAPLKVEIPEAERPLAFGEMLSEEAPPAEAPAQFGGFEASPPEAAPPPPMFEAPPIEAAPVFEAPPAPAQTSAPELEIEKEQQAWEIQTPISARDPLLADTVTDFMETPPTVEIPSEIPWETAPLVEGPGVEPPPAEAAPAEAAASFETAPVEAAPSFEAAPEAPAVDPALVDSVVQQVMERLTPQIVEAVARDLVRPLAESLLKEKLGK